MQRPSFPGVAALPPWHTVPAAQSVVESHERLQRRSEEHTSELQSLAYLVCRLLLEKKKKSNSDVNRGTLAKRLSRVAGATALATFAVSCLTREHSRVFCCSSDVGCMLCKLSWCSPA